MTTPSIPNVFAAIGWPMRLPPSGPFLTDGVSGAPLIVGPGSIGIVLRAQGTSGSVEAISSASLAAPTGLSNIPCLLPGGYHYDVKAELHVTADAVSATQEVLACNIEGSVDGGSTWFLFALARCNSPQPVVAGSAAIFEEVDVDRTTAPNNGTITNLRVRLMTIGGGGTLKVLPGACTLRVEQYIAAPVVTP